MIKFILLLEDKHIEPKLTSAVRHWDGPDQAIWFERIQTHGWEQEDET